MSQANDHNQSHCTDTDKFEDATDVLTKTNKEIIDEIIDKQSSLNLDAKESDDNVEEDTFVDCDDLENPKQSDPDNALQSDPDEASQRDYESTLSEEELNGNLAKAMESKKIGNDYFKNGDYEKSVESYSSGISICPLRCANERAILYGNRAAAHVQLSNNTMAMQDCSKALDLDPKYIKVALR